MNLIQHREPLWYPKLQTYQKKINEIEEKHKNNPDAIKPKVHSEDASKDIFQSKINMLERFLVISNLYDFTFETVLGKNTAEGIVLKAKFRDENSPYAKQLFAIKIFFNENNSHSFTLKTKHKKDLDMLFGIPKHPNVLYGLAHTRETVDTHFFEALPTNLAKRVPAALGQLVNGSLKVQSVILPLLSHTLSSLIEAKTLTVPQILNFMQQFALGLSHLHKHNYCHCDLKPDNLMISFEDTLVIIDFGCAVKIGAVTAGGNLAHTPPEEDAPARGSRDMFAAGCIFYTMLSGQNPFCAPSTTTIRWPEITSKGYPLRKVGAGKFVKSRIYFDPTVDKDIAELVAQLMSPTAEERPSAEELYNSIQKLAPRFK